MVQVEEDTVVRVATTKEEEDTVVVITEEGDTMGAGITEEEATEVDTTMAAKEEEATEVDTIMATTKEEEALMEEADIWTVSIFRHRFWRLWRRIQQ